MAASPRPISAREDVGAVARGVVNLVRHVENVGKFGVPVVVGVNHFTSDTEAELVGGARCDGEARREIACSARIGPMAVRARPTWRGTCSTWSGPGGPASRRSIRTTLPLAEKIRTVAREMYRAADIALPDSVARRLEAFDKAHPGLPVCIAKTQYSFSADPTATGAPEGHILPVREVRLSAGAGFVVVICGDIMTMPGLPRMPAAAAIRLRADGGVEGLF